MGAIPRRNVLKTAAVLGGASAVLGSATASRRFADGTRPPAAEATLTSAVTGPPVYGPVTVTSADPRYAELVTAYNQRWVGNPESVQLVGTTAQVASAVEAAVQAGRRIAVHGGGHCYANFVYNSTVQTVIDLSLMNNVYFDPAMNAYAVEGGAALGDVYETLYRGYGVAVPGGHCPTTGIGGHATGGGHGLLSREFGLITDHIAAVEMVVVDSRHKVNVVVAERNGANNDLWWAVSGGGGGNFGVITKYWFRSRSAAGTDPGKQLPQPPKNVLFSTVTVPWSSLTQAQFTSLLGNLGAFFAKNSSPSSPFTALSSNMSILHVSSGPISWVTFVDATVPNAASLLSAYHEALTAGTGISADIPYRTLTWLSAWETINTAVPLIETNSTLRNAVKCAYVNNGFTTDQITTIHQNMTRSDYSNPLPAMLQVGAMAGGAISAIKESETAISYRAATLLAFFQVYWPAVAGDAANIGWLRDLYGQTFASTGGFPVPGDAYQGCTINLPDPDVLDPTINTKKIPWPTLYYGSNYPRLQEVKAAWDPTNFFQHPMSITAS